MLFVLPCLKKTARRVIKVARSQPLGRRFPWRPWLNRSRTTFGCNCICILSDPAFESHFSGVLWGATEIKTKKGKKNTQGVCCGFPTSQQTLGAFLTCCRREGVEVGGILREHNHARCFWTACCFYFMHLLLLPTHVLAVAAFFPRPLCHHVAW